MLLFTSCIFTYNLLMGSNTISSKIFNTKYNNKFSIQFQNIIQNLTYGEFKPIKVDGAVKKYFKKVFIYKISRLKN